MSEQNKELLEQLFNATIEYLLNRIKAGEATAADLGVARALLKDNDINAIPREGSGLDALAQYVPFNSVESLEDEERTVEGLTARK
jgi:hypothetical protein